MSKKRRFRPGFDVPRKYHSPTPTDKEVDAIRFKEEPECSYTYKCKICDMKIHSCEKLDGKNQYCSICKKGRIN